MQTSFRKNIAGAITVISILLSSSAYSGEYDFCLLLNKVANAGKLETYSDKQVENGLCMTSKEVVKAISSGDKFHEDICTTSATFMMKEFKKRFGDRNPDTVICKC